MCLQSITALAHLRAAVLYIVDISEQCGYTIAQQAALFHSIRPLFANKPLIIVANKTDVVKPDSLSDADKACIRDMGIAAAKASNPGAQSPFSLYLALLANNPCCSVWYVLQWHTWHMKVAPEASLLCACALLPAFCCIRAQQHSESRPVHLLETDAVMIQYMSQTSV